MPGVVVYLSFIRGPCVRNLFTGLIMYLPSQNNEHCIVLYCIVLLIRTRSESVLTVIVELLCSKKKKRLTQSHIIAEKKSSIKKQMQFP